MQFSKKLLLAAVLGTAVSTAAFADGQVTLIHTGDFHGHLTARPNLRSNAEYPGQMVGGLARIKTEIQRIQAGKGGAGNTLVLHTGDTIQGSGEALYTRGQAMVEVVDMLGVDFYAPGNWDFVYGPDRFIELFASNLNANLPTLPDQARGATVAPPFGTRWGGLVANVYKTNGNAPKRPNDTSSAQGANLSQAEYDAYANFYMDKGQRILPPYAVRYVNGVKVGVLGCTTSRGPQVVGSWVTKGLEFTDCTKEVQHFTRHLRTVEQVELVVLISEIEIGRNIQLMKSLAADQHVDVVLNSDMHEETTAPIEVVNPVTGKKTWIIEEGQDGTMVGEITLSVHAGQVTGMQHFPHRIDDRIPEDTAVAAKVAQVRYPFNEGFDASIACSANSPYRNPFSADDATTCLKGPLSAEVGRTDVGLHRSNYSDEYMPAAIEGSSHDLIADAIRWWAKSDLATVRGFRYGTHVAPGPITRNDIFHFIPIGPRVAKASRVSANQLRNQIDNSSLGVFSSDPGSVVTPRPIYNNGLYANYTLNDSGTGNAVTSPGAGLPIGGLGGNALGWTGGWLFAYSGDGFHMDFDPYFVPSWQTVYSGSATTSSPSGIYLGNNTQKATPPTDTSRARSLTVRMACGALPPTDVLRKEVGSNGEVKDGNGNYPFGTVVITLGNDVTCNSLSAGYTGYGVTVITRASNGQYMPSWTANYASTAVYTPYLLNPDGWTYLNGTPNQPNTLNTVNQHFKAGLFSVAGYWYAQSPNTINNCNNCYATGKVNGNVMGNMSIADPNSQGNKLINPDVAFLLPVNEINGEAALDGNKNPRLVQDTSKPDGIARDGSNRPISAGNPIDLTEIVEKYLAAIGTVTTGPSGNLQLNRIGLVNAWLPASSAGLRTMQPLCGTIGQNPASLPSCP